jgi:hypothetical protein
MSALGYSLAAMRLIVARCEMRQRPSLERREPNGKCRSLCPLRPYG